jgi:glutamyl endopeptidase
MHAFKSGRVVLLIAVVLTAIAAAPAGAAPGGLDGVVTNDGLRMPTPTAAPSVGEAVARAPSASAGFAGLAPAGSTLGATVASTNVGPPATATEGGAETIIGSDRRTLVSPTTVYPARAVVLITFTGGRCSGNLVAPDLVMTAGHCVHTGGSAGSWRTNVRVWPGRNGTLAPYGSFAAARLFSVSGWTTSKNEAYDYGAIDLSTNIGNTVGWFGYFWQSASMVGLPAIINGYPGDKPLTQWQSSNCSIFVIGFSQCTIGVSQSHQNFYRNDTIGGMSGSGVYYNRVGCGLCIGTIHAYGLHGSWPHSTYNHGTRIREAVFNNYQNWANNF